jgi:hypothetical protein
MGKAGHRAEAQLSRHAKVTGANGAGYGITTFDNSGSSVSPALQRGFFQ